MIVVAKERKEVSDKRKYIKCVLRVENNVNIPEFIVDTGAIYTCCNYNEVIGLINLQELQNCPVKRLAGIDKSAGIKFHKITLDSMSIGGLGIGGVYLWVTTDSKMEKAILGMDILNNLNTLNIAGTGTMIISNSLLEVANYVYNVCNGMI